jgi:hypothetical protein
MEVTGALKRKMSLRVFLEPQWGDSDGILQIV